MIPSLDPTLRDALEALGLLASDGSLDPAWFEEPLERARRMLQTPAQRRALLRVLASLRPADEDVGTRGRWHPIVLGSRAGVYLTVDDGDDALVIGAAARAVAASPQTTLLVELPLVRVDAAGEHGLAEPLVFDLRVNVGWQRPARALGLEAVRLRASTALTGADDFAVSAVIEQLDLGDGLPARDVPIDDRLGDEAGRVIVALARHGLEGADAEAATLRAHLLPLLGLDDAIPALPLATLKEPRALRSWLAEAAGATWLGHLAALFGAPLGATTGDGTVASPWRARVIDFGGSGIDVTAAIDTSAGTRHLRMGIAASAAGAPARIAAHATLFVVPLEGNAAPAALPELAVVLEAPADSTPLVDSADVRIGGLRAGLGWDGSALAPVLELRDVRLGATRYDRLDLSSADAVVEAAATVVRDAIVAALGASETARRLRALIGLGAPAADPAWPHAVDLSQLAAHPTRAIAEVHRRALADASHGWDALFGEIAALLGLGSVEGSGTRTDPWRARLAEHGVLTVELAAWNARDTVERLRLGLRVHAASDPGELVWLCEVLGFDLPQAAAAHVRLSGAQQLTLRVAPVPPAPELFGVALDADAVALTLDWEPGGALRGAGVIEGLAFETEEDSVTLAALRFPPSSPFDAADPAASLGITGAELEAVLRMLSARAALVWGGAPAWIASALVGVHAALPGLPRDWPVLRAQSGQSSWLEDPDAAVRAALKAIATGVSADGTPFAWTALAWLRGWLDDALPGSLLEAPEVPLEGGGRHDDPWIVPIRGGAIETLLWLEPAGPPVPRSALERRVAAATGYRTLIDAAARMAAFHPPLRDALYAVDRDALAIGVRLLGVHLEDGDGLVEKASQLPSGASWSHAEVASGHARLPKHPAAITQVLDRIDTWAPSSRAVLLLSPPFADDEAWSDLLAAAATRGHAISAEAHFAGAPEEVTVVADYYHARLTDDGLEALVERVRALRGGMPVVVVAHSVAGLQARALVAARPELIAGLVTLGTPHGGASLAPLRDARIADALRFLERAELLDIGIFGAALEQLVRALEGWQPSADGPPRFAPFPLEAFAASPSSDTGSVPALAIAGVHEEPFVEALRERLRAVVAALAAPPLPTHVGLGARVKLPLPAPPATTIVADIALRLDAAPFAILPDAAPLGDRAAEIRCRLSRRDGWLVGSAGARSGSAPPPDERLRWAEIGFDLAGERPFVRLHQGASRGHAHPVVELDHSEVAPLLDAAIRALDRPALHAALEALQLAVRDVRGEIGLSADAVTALSIDGGAFLRPRLAAALARPEGLLGLRAGEPLALGGFQLTVSPAPWSIALSTSGLSLGATAALDIDARSESGTTRLDASLHFGAMRLAMRGGELTIDAPPWLERTVLAPSPGPAARADRVAQLVPALLASMAMAAALEGTFGPAFTAVPVHHLLLAPGKALARPQALGGPAGPDGNKVGKVLRMIGAAFGTPDATGWPLPGGLQLSAEGADPLVLTLATTTPVAGIASFALRLAIDASLHVMPAGTLALAFDLGEAPWARLTVAFAASAAGVSLTLTPADGPPIRLLPTFGGFGALAGGAAALLPHALDELVAALPASPLRTLALRVAESLGIYDAAGGFSAHADALRDLATPGWPARVAMAARAPIAAAVADLFNDPSSPLAAVPGSVSTSGALVTWQAPSSPIALTVGWQDDTPVVRFVVAGLEAPPVRLDLVLEHAGALSATGALDLSLASSLGLEVRPRLTFDGTALTLLPLGTDAFAVSLAPSFGVAADDAAIRQLARAWLLPLIARLLVDVARPRFGDALWAQGPTLEELLVSGELLRGSSLAVPLPPLSRVAAGLLRGMANAASPAIELSPDLSLRATLTPNKLGIWISGEASANVGDFEATARFGASWSPDPRPGAVLWIYDVSAEGTLSFQPSLRLAGIGLRVGRANDEALVSNDAFRLGAAAAYVFLDRPLRGGTATEPLGAAIELEDIGLPLGLASSAGGNPVAAGLLRSEAPSGDREPVAPAVHLVTAYRNGELRVLFGGQRTLTLDVQRSFGPVSIKRIVIAPTADPGAAILIDGGVSIAGLTVQVDDLSVAIPFSAVLSPDAWRLDLAGLGVGFRGAGVTLAGALTKHPGPPLEYRGILQASVAGRSLSAIGAYARPRDAQGELTSLFVFAVVPGTFGGPPFFFVTGLAGGAGYNRQLRLPERVEDVARHPLLLALDEDALVDDPMGAIDSMGAALPVRRGSFWLAAGVRFTTFGLITTRALVSVAIDREVEVGLMGLSRMVLPSADRALVNVELALRARYSSAEQLLSVQGELTDRSWLFHRDCRLTGGFALYVWFADDEALLTLGGYHPAFARPARFPVVPRLGFRWRASSHTVIKGEAYFALTTSCVMAGGLLSIDYRKGGVHAWFEAKANLLVSWDPFYYDIEIGVSVGASVRIRVCFIECWTKTLHFSVSAHLHLTGPPLRGELSVGLGPVSITVPFGAKSSKPSYLPSFGAFVAKHLSAEAAGQPVSVALRAGLSPGAELTDGSASAPWHVGAEPVIAIESRMAATRIRPFVGPAPAVAVDDLDIAPMGDVAVVRSDLFVHLERATPTGFVPIGGPAGGFAIEPIAGRVPEALWRYQEPGEVAAAANTLAALTGALLEVRAQALRESAVIGIAGLVDDLPELARPLPFATRASHDISAWIEAGQAAEILAGARADASSRSALAAAEVVLSGEGVFAAARARAGLSRTGLAPLARRALRRRSAPPRIAPLSAGLTMRPVGLPAPPLRAAAPRAALAPLAAPRLRAVLRQQPSAEATSDAPATRTTITSASGVARIRPPRAEAVAGALLVPRRAPSRTPGTALAALGVSRRSTELWAPMTRAHAAAMSALADSLGREGVSLPAGVWQLWDLPAGSHAVHLAGDGATRVSCVSRAGAVLLDDELPPGEHRVALPPQTQTLVIGCLGKADRVPIRRGFGAASAAIGRSPAVGWQCGGRALFLGRGMLLARGAIVRVDRSRRLQRHERPAIDALVTIDEALADATAIETWLPITTQVVALVLDIDDPTAAERGDLRIASDGGELGDPLRIVGTRRRVVLYDVVARRPHAERLRIAAASLAGYRVAGVVGLGGTAAAWSKRGAIPDVVDGPWSAAGATHVRLLQGEPE